MQVLTSPYEPTLKRNQKSVYCTPMKLMTTANSQIFQFTVNSPPVPWNGFLKKPKKLVLVENLSVILCNEHWGNIYMENTQISRHAISVIYSESCHFKKKTELKPRYKQRRICHQKMPFVAGKLKINSYINRSVNTNSSQLSSEVFPYTYGLHVWKCRRKNQHWCWYGMYSFRIDVMAFWDNRCPYNKWTLIKLELISCFKKKNPTANNSRCT